MRCSPASRRRGGIHRRQSRARAAARGSGSCLLAHQSTNHLLESDAQLLHGIAVLLLRHPNGDREIHGSECLMQAVIGSDEVLPSHWDAIIREPLTKMQERALR